MRTLTACTYSIDQNQVRSANLRLILRAQMLVKSLNHFPQPPLLHRLGHIVAERGGLEDELPPKTRTRLPATATTEQCVPQLAVCVCFLPERVREHERLLVLNSAQ